MALWTSDWTSPESGASLGFAGHALKTGSRDSIQQEQPADNGAMNKPTSPAPKDVSPRPANTLHARDFMALADQLSC